ncbi:MAG: ribonuclease D [Coriobacteriia bacterium]|nr:ribonuclease D [Coriobacteriia bacterium]
MYIDTQEELEAFVARAHESSVLAIDTEFLREKTYYAKLCLIQMATDDEVVIVDPFAVRDMKVLAPLLTNEDVVKLFHAGTQDLEILYHEVGVLPKPIFDTQIAASLLGHVLQIGYANLVHAECGVTLKKVDSFTDWSRRPLSDSQIEYAADDVIYLPRMYQSMTKQLKQKRRLGWLSDDFAELSNPANYEQDSRERFRRLKRGGSLNRQQLSAAREVAAWREDTAKKRNLPRKWVLTDEQIVEACKRGSRTIDDLFMVRGMREKLSTRDARVVVGLICQGLDLPEDQWPDLPRGGRNEPNVDVEVDLMMAIARIRARENDVALQALASHSDLERMARGHTEGVEVLRGWRRNLVGKELKDLLAGKLTLSIGKNGVEITKKN